MDGTVESWVEYDTFLTSSIYKSEESSLNIGSLTWKKLGALSPRHVQISMWYYLLTYRTILILDYGLFDRLVVHCVHSPGAINSTQQ